MKKQDPPKPAGESFEYMTATTNVVGHLLEAVLEKNDGKDGLPRSSVEFFGDHFWSKGGAHKDGFINVDETGFPWWGAGGMATLRDMVRFGEMLLKYGQSYDGTQVIPKETIEDIKNPPDANRKQFANGAAAALNTLFQKGSSAAFPKWSFFAEDYMKAIGEPEGRDDMMAYRNFFWVIRGHIICMIGVQGQHVFVDYDANMVIAKHSSNVNQKESTDLELPMMLSISAYYQELAKNPVSSGAIRQSSPGFGLGFGGLVVGCLCSVLFVVM